MISLIDLLSTTISDESDLSIRGALEIITSYCIVGFKKAMNE